MTTGRIYDTLVARLGKQNVFKDVYSIVGGDEVGGRIQKAIRETDTVVAVIGLHWEGPCEDSALHRIDQDTDWVRLELEAALCAKVSLVPVLVDPRKALDTAQLPEALKSIAALNALRIRQDPDFKQDIKRLLHAVGYRWWHARLTWFLPPLVIAVSSLAVIVGTMSRVEEWDRVMVANFERGQWDAADISADKILREKPSHLRALSVKGSVAALSGEFRTAVKFFRKAYEQDPENRVVRRNLAYAYLHTGRTEDAIKLYEQLRDGSASAEYSVACAYVGAKRYSDALKILDEMPETQIGSEGKSPVGQVSILYAAALMGRDPEADREVAIKKLRFGISQSPGYWLPILRGEEHDPQNDYSLQIVLLRPILEPVLASIQSGGY
jgi:tetratricopeptide (TPR) repeat protein